MNKNFKNLKIQHNNHKSFIKDRHNYYNLNQIIKLIRNNLKNFIKFKNLLSNKINF